MPTYEYACSKCKTSYELREGFDAPTTQACQECGKGTAKRVLYAPPVVFKGGGWYATDSRNAKSARVDSGDTAGDASSDSTPVASESKAETKKTETKKTEAKTKTESAAAG